MLLSWSARARFARSLTRSSLRCQRMLRISWTIQSIQSVFLNVAPRLVRDYNIFSFNHPLLRTQHIALFMPNIPPPFFSFSFLRIFLMFLTIELLADSCDLNKNPGRALWKRKEGAQRRTAHMFKPRLCRAWMKSSCSGGYAVMLIHSQALWKVDFSSRYHFGKFTNPVTFTWQYLNLKLKYKVLVRFYINHPTTCAWRI